MASDNYCYITESKDKDATNTTIRSWGYGTKNYYYITESKDKDAIDTTNSSWEYGIVLENK